MTHPATALAHLLDMPEREPWGGLAILHGAGSRKENHADMAAAAAAAGLAVVRFDMRGHGATGGLLDGRAIEDVAAAAALLPAGLPFALRGSSMGGYLALVSARAVRAAAVVAVCPAHAPLLARGLRTGELEVAADTAALEALLSAHPLEAAVAALDVPVLLQHAEQDERVPVAGSRALAPLLRHPASRLDVTPGGDHRSVQHDPAAQAAALEWLGAAMAEVGAAHRPGLWSSCDPDPGQRV
jgi:pimeloyl-ACP methyl ester carboxylesterase